MGLIRRLLEVVKAEFEVGRDRGSVFVWNPEKGEFEFLEAERVRWERYARRGEAGVGEFSLPEGAVVKYVKYVRGLPPDVEYYLAEPGGLRRLRYREVTRTEADFEGIKIMVSCNVPEGVEGVEDCVYYIAGYGDPLTRAIPGPLNLPTRWTSREETRRVAETLSRLAEAWRDVKERVRQAVGAEPVRLVDFEPEFVDEAERVVVRGGVCVKLPYLGREKFREVAARFEYDDLRSCFWFRSDVIGRDAIEKLSRVISRP